nr:hypothetical protein [Tanacetum cinerariifolium]
MRIRSSNSRMATWFANPERQFRAKRDTLPTPIHNIYTFYEYESSESESKDNGEIDIETLTLEQYLNLNNTHNRKNNPEKNTFEIKGQFLRELHKITFSGCSNENAIEHIRKILKIASLFNTDDSTLLQVFPLTLIGVAKRWFDGTSPRHAKNWDELKQNFIRGFCPPTMILKQLGEIRNFKLKGQTRRIVDSNGLIPGLTVSKALRLLQELADYSHKWHNEECKNTPSSFSIIAKKLKALNHEMDGLRADVRKINTNDGMRSLHEEIIMIEEVSMVKLNARCFDVLQNELPPKEKDPGSFNLPCTIGTTTLSNALADLEASISIMPFSLFKRLGLGNPKPINMVIEMADRSMQSPMGIVKNVLVKINKCIFPIDFIILDIIKDNKVPIIIGRPMLATAHARIDIFGKKISLEVRTEQITFDINKKLSPVVISPVYVINSFSKTNKPYEPRDLEELLLSNDDLDIFPNNNNLLPNLESHDNILLSPTGSARFNNNSSEIFYNPNSNSSISMDDFVKIGDVWDNLDYRDFTYKGTKSPVKTKFLKQ